MNTPDTNVMRATYATAATYRQSPVTARAAEFDRWLTKVKADAVREHEEKRVVIHMDPPAPAVRYVPAPCPRCGWSR